METKGSGSVVLTKHSQVSLYRSLHHFMPQTLNTPHLLCSDHGARLLDQLLQFLYSGVWKPSFAHSSHVQCQVQVGLLPLYMYSLPCHCSRQVEYVQEICCCF
jgi:hypothetical protein